MARHSVAPMSEEHIVRALKALADPTRFRMIQEIAAAGELNCGQVAQLFDISQPTISHHMKVLSDAGLLIVRTLGKHHYVKVHQTFVASLLDALPGRLTANEANRPHAGRADAS